MAGGFNLVLIGPHGSGKTTLGRLLATALGRRFDGEIGRLLRDWALRDDPAAHAMGPQPDFDRLVFWTERGRDLRASNPRIVETWHPGNLAYVRQRNPDLASRLLPFVRAAVVRAGPTVVQPLRISPATARARLTEPGPEPASMVQFFLSVGAEAERVALELGLRLLPPVATDVLPPLAAVAQILGALQSRPRAMLAALPPHGRSRYSWAWTGHAATAR